MRKTKKKWPRSVSKPACGTTTMRCSARKPGSQLNTIQPLIQLQQNVGNQAVVQFVQANLKMGLPLPEPARIPFESQFGCDFSDVRIHDDSRSVDMAKALDARAFTFGNNIVFDKGEYRPGSVEGQKLVAHELVHVTQQIPFEPQRQGKPIVKGSVASTGVDVKPISSSSSPFIQRHGRNTGRICSGLTFQVTVPGIISSAAGGAKVLKLGPFSCILGKCRIRHGSQAISIINVRKYYKYLLKAVNFSKKLINRISGYLKRVSATAKYSAFVNWLQKIAGVKPSKPGATPSAAVAAETVAFISPTSIINEWSKLGKIKPPTGADPFDNWVSMLHEQHHRKTILSHPSIVQAYQQIGKAKAALLSNRNMMAPFDKNLRSKPDKEIPKHIRDEQITIQAMQKKTYRDLNFASAGRLRALGIKKLLTLKYIPNRKRVLELVSKYKKLRILETAYYTNEISLKRSLQQHYGNYEKWIEKARNFALEDLKAYCVSWQAEKNALAFIKRCCRAALRGKSGRRRR
jgi:hypothetical protein